MSARQLGTQFGIDVAACILAALLLSAAVGAGLNYFQRLFFVTVLGLLSALVVNVPQWNWYAFPAEFTLARVVEHMAGFFIAGILIAALIRRPKQAAPAQR
jgi:hypothetical protein